MTNIGTILKADKTVIVDVRTPQEFMGGHVAGSLNIPLNEVPQRLNEIKNIGSVVLCCASGGRSHQATLFLKENGVECVNGGSWLDVNYHKNN